MLKKKPHDFIKHRSSKLKISTGGKSSRTDSSYHANLDKVETWMAVLEKASLENDDDAIRAVPNILNLIRTMLSKDPMERPLARDVRDDLFDILQCTSMLDIHCGAHKHDIGIAASAFSSRERASSMASFSTMSTMSSAFSDTDTIRSGTTQVNSILDYYSDKHTLPGIIEDDSASLQTLEPPATSPCAVKYNETPRLPDSPTMPEPPQSPSSPAYARGPSPSRPTASAAKVKPWNKPFLLLP